MLITNEILQNSPRIYLDYSFIDLKFILLGAQLPPFQFNWIAFFVVIVVL